MLCVWYDICVRVSLKDLSTGDPTTALSATNTTTCECPRIHTSYRSFHQPWEIEATRHLYYATDIVPIKVL